MTRAGATLTIAAIALWSVGVFAQGRNFEGSWVVDTEKTAAAMGSMAAGGGGMRSGGGGGTVGGVVATGGGVRGGGGGGGVGGGGVARSGGGGGRGGGAPAPTVISLDATTFTVGAGEARTAYKLDGSPTRIERPNGTVVTAKASWAGDKLTITSVTDTPNGQISNTTVWYLEGESLVRETSAPGPDGEMTTRKTYFKRA